MPCAYILVSSRTREACARLPFSRCPATDIDAAIALLAITGQVQSRFIRSASLLGMLDPVRAEVTTRCLDGDANTTDLVHEQFLKRKFLDSCALVCVARKGGDRRVGGMYTRRRPTRDCDQNGPQRWCKRRDLPKIRLIVKLNSITKDARFPLQPVPPKNAIPRCLGRVTNPFDPARIGVRQHRTIVLVLVSLQIPSTNKLLSRLASVHRRRAGKSAGSTRRYSDDAVDLGVNNQVHVTAGAWDRDSGCSECGGTRTDR
jgi:hypothetical protein